ncbi:hypothetical protein PHMEG_00013146 [Phytophthora megakarya]|uniref:Uncharacterized protein n=1 Tax=Phytophthora megakarya TaxID=4795 RepID=A0A225W9J7_9STRA|nr:hypothetical protein PHMEG_00013146 [Phytophthora megakarya]
MGLDELQSGNNSRAKTPVIGAFKKFLKVEQVTEEYIRKCIECDESGKCFVSVMLLHTDGEMLELLMAIRENSWSIEDAADATGIPRLTLLGYVAAEEDIFSILVDPKVEGCSAKHSAGSPLVCTTSLVRVRSDKESFLWTVHEGELRRLETCTWLNGTVVSYLIREHMHPNDSTFNFDTQRFGAIEREYVSSKRNSKKTCEKCVRFHGAYPTKRIL